MIREQLGKKRKTLLSFHTGKSSVGVMERSQGEVFSAKRKGKKKKERKKTGE